MIYSRKMSGIWVESSPWAQRPNYIMNTQEREGKEIKENERKTNLVSKEEVYMIY